MRIFAVAFMLTLLSPLASGQTAATRVKKAAVTPMAKASGPWSSLVRYSVLTDYADNRTPRSYTHSFVGALGYAFNKKFAAELNVGARAELIDGQISKGREQEYDETIGPSTSLVLNYGWQFWGKDRFEVYAEGEPLWDSASRLEGYKGIVGLGMGASMKFFDNRYVMSHDLSVSELLNSYRYSSSLSPNPDYFYTYKFSNVLKIYRGLRASYSFGMKVTEYMDDFVGYAYSNSTGLSYVWPQLSVSLSYDNGGFTDNGEIALWYLDQYRRLARVSMGYTF